MSMVEVIIDSIRVSLTGQYRLVVLKEVGAERHLLIYVSPETADAIHYHLQEVVVSRPLTHDLLKNLISHLGGRVSHIIVNDLNQGVYYAKIVMDRNGQSMEIDARPSDAIALAVRTGAKLFVDDRIMAEAAVMPEEGLDIETGVVTEDGVESVDPEDLESFRDFVDSLDLDDLP